MAAFLVIRFLAGLASAFVMVFMASIVFSHLVRADRNDLQALHFGGVGLGIAASSALMAVLVTDHAGWAAGWLWSAAISACGLAVVAWLVGSTSTASGVAGREPPLPKDQAAAEDDRCLWPVRLRLCGDGDVPGRHRPPGRRRARLRGSGLDGHRPCRSSLRLALAEGRRTGSGSTRPMPWAASSRWSASPPASPSAAMPGRCWPASCSAAPSSPHRARPADGKTAGSPGATPYPGDDDGRLRHWPDHRPDRRRAARPGLRQLTCSLRSWRPSFFWRPV